MSATKVMASSKLSFITMMLAKLRSTPAPTLIMPPDRVNGVGNLLGGAGGRALIEQPGQERRDAPACSRDRWRRRRRPAAGWSRLAVRDGGPPSPEGHWTASRPRRAGTSRPRAGRGGGGLSLGHTSVCAGTCAAAPAERTRLASGGSTSRRQILRRPISILPAGPAAAHRSLESSVRSSAPICSPA